MGISEIVAVVVGIGRIGKVHAANLIKIPKVQIRYIVDICKDAVDEYIQSTGLKNTIGLHLDDLKSVALKDPKVNIVIICTPTCFHEDQVIAALEAGKSVMCEKPLALTLKSIVHCYQVAQEHKVQLYCAFNRRYDSGFLEAVSRKEDEIGRLKSVKLTSRDYPRNTIEYLKISGGMCTDMCIHDIDIIRWIVGQNPIEVYAVGHAFFDDIREIDDVDQLFITMRFPNGSMAHVDANREALYGQDNRVEIFGDKGMIQCNNPFKLGVDIHTQASSSAIRNNRSVIGRFNDSYYAEILSFVAAVRGEEKLGIKAKDVVWNTLLCIACDHSLTSKSPVAVQDFVKEKYSHILQALEKLDL
uniref:uncharacterized protein LOC100178609 n=1 Tax=Ciona intestinalis TaxID=7719 RepID=UPI000180D2E8|nr:uncharacterized protein LOC100178609 [Ciona intestinalis]|eukprot:XP_002131635.1 uncharacterized protein LOC100178609 [Ciona intestinalis]